jgi:hypothetical protein
MPGYQATAVLDNVFIGESVRTTVIDNKGHTILDGGTKLIDSWALGRRYTEAYENGVVAAGKMPVPRKHSSMLGFPENSNPPPGSPLSFFAKFFERTKPQYSEMDRSVFKNVLDYGVSNDGSYPNLNSNLINIALKEAAAEKKILVFPAGIYKVDNTLIIPPGTRMVGALWSQIMAIGKKLC